MRYKRISSRSRRGPGQNDQSSPITIRGRIETVFYAAPQFSAGGIRTNYGDRVSFAGSFFAREGEEVILSGHWTVHPKYGRQIQVETVELDLDLDTDGLVRYLSNHPEMKGIGPQKARQIADALGKDFDRVITEEPERVAKEAKISLVTAHQIRAVWLETKVTNKVASHLAGHGLTHHQIVKLVDKFGVDTLAILKADPYRIISEIKGFGFKRADKIALAMGISKNDPARIRAGIMHCIDEALDQGHCWTEIEELIDRVNQLLIMDDLDSRDQIDRELARLIDSGSLACASHDGRFLIALPRIQQMEEDLARWLRRGREPNPNFPDQESLTGWIEHTAPTLNEKQQESVLNAMRHKLSVITGPAGSGKTYTLSCLTEICEEGEISVVLAALTGKAAKRLEQLVARPAKTVHRLLGFDGAGFTAGPDNLLDADMIIIDEVSMMDTHLAWQLLRAIDLDRTAVVLVGDHNQLPPVGPGNLLRDLVRTGAIPTVILDRIVRQAGVLKENCIAVLNGEVRKTSGPADTPSSPRPWYVVDRFTDLADAQRCLLELFENDLADRLGFDLIHDVQLLTPTHKGPLGTHELNIALQRVVQKKLWNVDVLPTPPGRRPKFLPHDKVIQTRNNYEIGVMNGTMGVVSEVCPGGALIVSFEGQPVKIEGEDLQDIHLAYCLTIHRTQGSEFPCAIVVVHKAHSFMHHRNLLYTAVTRARQTAILIGDRWGMQNCANKRSENERRTFLSFLLHE